MYTLIRKIHLYAGLVILLFMLMYFVTGYAMIHEKWFPKETPTTETLTISLASYTGPKTPEALADYLDQTQSVHGRLVPSNNNPKPTDPLKFSIYHPSLTFQIELPPNSADLALKTTHNTFTQTLSQLHRIHGYGTGGWLFNGFVFLNDLASFSCILFAITGVILWWISTRRKIWGVLCLGASCAYGLAMILYLLYAR